MANRENVLRVADAIERETVPGLGFDMQWFYNPGTTCGTTACIAGWCAVMDGHDLASMSYFRLRNFDYMNVGMNFLGIDYEQADRLFYNTKDSATKVKAVETLRRLADTDEVDWKDGEDGEDDQG